MNDLNNDKQTDAAEEEMTSLKKNHTWSLIDRPKDQKSICCIKIFKRKPGIVGVESPSYKARLVTKGQSQKKGIDYQKMFGHRLSDDVCTSYKTCIHQILTVRSSTFQCGTTIA